MEMIFGRRFLPKCQRWIPLISYISYLTCTNVIGLQTLGEEFSGLVQFTHNGKIPSIGRRILYVFIVIFLQRIVPIIGSQRLTNSTLTDMFNFFNNTFYAFGLISNYCIARSFARIFYLSTYKHFNKVHVKLLFLIFLFAIIQSFTVLIFKITKIKSRKNYQEPISRKKSCKICSAIKQQICLPCGHVCCISCIRAYNSDDTRVKCAYCRKITSFDMLIPLLNF